MPKTINRITSEAVHKATGRTWDEWLKLLDKAGAKKLNHKETARLIWDKKLIKKAGLPRATVEWWCQMVTVGYEHARGKRIVGETADVGFEIGVTKTLPLSTKQAWDLIMSSAGRKLWLGNLPQFTLAAGKQFTTKQGTTGEIRTLKARERIRLRWHPKMLKAPSTLQVTVSKRQSTTGSTVGFHQEKLSSQAERTKMRAHWQKVLRSLAALT